MNGKRVVVWLGVLVIATVVALFLRPRTVEMHGDWPYYGSVEAIAGRADAIVIGSVAHLEYKYDSTLDLVWTEATIRVTKTVKGKALPASIIVTQLGGKRGNVTYKESSTTPFTVGQNVFLFLRMASPSSQTYAAVNPYEGSLLITNATVKFGNQPYSVDELIKKALASPDTRNAKQKEAAGEP